MMRQGVSDAPYDILHGSDVLVRLPPLLIGDSMTFNLKGSGYKLNHNCNLWQRPQAGKYDSRNQSALDIRLKSALEQSNDLSLFSPDLKKHLLDWPSFYHLASCRANILRPFEDRLRNASVLEIGAGCGAVSRYLGEAGASAICLEQDLNHAIIASQRVSDLPNISVVNDNLSTFKCENKFDLVTLIAPLDSPNFFCTWEMPFDELLVKAQSFLKPDGLLIIAIDNQIGLKYLAGAPDSQNGIRGYGIEDRHNSTNFSNFGRITLKELLENASLNYSKFLLPFPSYTSPISIITESGLNDPDFDFGVLAVSSVDKDRQLPDNLAFNLQLAWPVINRNKLCLDLANSFLVVASRYPQNVMDDNVLAFHYTSNRAACFCKQTLFIRKPNNSIKVAYRKLSSTAVNSRLAKIVCMRLPEEADYVKGKAFGQVFSRLFASNEWSVELIVNELIELFNFINLNFANMKKTPFDKLKEFKLDGAYFDAVPNNIIIDSAGIFHHIDEEWYLEQPLSLGWYIFRVLLSVINSAPVINQPKWETPSTKLELFKEIFHRIGLRFSENDILDFGCQEASIQSLILAANVPSDFWGPYSAPFKINSVFEKLDKLNLVNQIQKDQILSLEETNSSSIRELDLAKEREITLSRLLGDTESKYLASEAHVKHVLEQGAITISMLEEAKCIQNSLILENHDLREDLNHKLSRVQSLESAVNQSQGLCSQLQSEIETLREANHLADISTKDLREQVSTLNVKATSLTNQVLDTQNINGILTSKLAESASRVLMLEHQLNGIIKSRSWRLTAPLRFIMRMLHFRVA